MSRPVTEREALDRAAQWPVGRVVAAIAAAGVVFAMVAAGYGWGIPWLVRVDATTNQGWVAGALAHPRWADLARATTFWGNTSVVIVVTGVVVSWQLYRRRRLIAGWVGATVVLGWLVNSTAKAAVDRTRPPTVGLLVDAHGSSFPSGHAQVGGYGWLTFGLLALLVLVGRRRWVVAAGCWVLGALVALSRVVLGVHWTSDVVAGWALGAGVALVSVSVLVVTARGASGSVLEGEPGNFRRVESEDLSEERQLGLERDDL